MPVEGLCNIGLLKSFCWRYGRLQACWAQIHAHSWAPTFATKTLKVVGSLPRRTRGAEKNSLFIDSCCNSQDLRAPASLYGQNWRDHVRVGQVVVVGTCHHVQAEQVGGPVNYP